MFGQLGQIAHLMKNAGQIRQQIQEVQARLDAARFVGEAGAGQVQATTNGKGELLGIKLDPALVEAADRELMEELIVAAVHDAVRRSRETAQKEIEAAAGGLNLQGVMEMFGVKR